MNGLNNSALFPYSLNNLQQITTSDGGSLPVQADVPIIKTLTTTAQEIALYESSPDLIDFEFYNKSLKVDTIFAGSGSISSLTGGLCNFNTGSFKTLNSGVLISTTGSISSLTGGQLFFNSGTFTNITAGNITISTLNIPNLSFTTATGGQLYTQNIDNKELKFPWWFKIIAYILSFSFSITSLFFIIVKGITFGDDKVRKWLTSLVISFLTSIFLTQPLQVTF